MARLKFELNQLVRSDREGSFSTQATRGRILALFADELRALGFNQVTAKGIKTKHVDALLSRWHERNLAPGTIKNRMAHLRWWADRVGRSGVVKRDNDAYGIERRKYVTNIDKSRVLDAKVYRISDPYVRQSLALQQAFGLRREEAIKFQPAYADRTHSIVLKSSWTKGGKEREIPVRTAEQRAVLDDAHRLAGNGSLIPNEKKYVEQLKVYENQTHGVGLSKLHGLRHAYAQSRYLELTGWQSPVRGGVRRNAMDAQQLEKDIEARLTISHELGHERLEIVAVYLGS